MRFNAGSTWQEEEITFGFRANGAALSGSSNRSQLLLRHLISGNPGVATCDSRLWRLLLDRPLRGPIFDARWDLVEHGTAEAGPDALIVTIPWAAVNFWMLQPTTKVSN